MRRIERTNAFRRDFKRELRGRHRQDLESLLKSAIEMLAEDNLLPESNRDHALQASGATIAIATSSPTFCRSIARSMRYCSSSAWGHIASCSGKRAYIPTGSGSLWKTTVPGRLSFSQD